MASASSSVGKHRDRYRGRIIFSADGLASRKEIGEDWRTRTVAWANPASELRRYHDLPLPVSLEEHYSDTPIGKIVGIHHAEGSGGTVAWAIAELTADGSEGLLDYPGPVSSQRKPMPPSNEGQRSAGTSSCSAPL